MSINCDVLKRNRRGQLDMLSMVGHMFDGVLICALRADSLLFGCRIDFMESHPRLHFKSEKVLDVYTLFTRQTSIAWVTECLPRSRRSRAMYELINGLRAGWQFYLCFFF